MPSVRFAKTKSRYGKIRDHLNIGFAATIDCAIVIAAQELRLFEKYGLTVRLSREVGWATIREKLLHEELDAAAVHRLGQLRPGPRRGRQQPQADLPGAGFRVVSAPGRGRGHPFPGP